MHIVILTGSPRQNGNTDRLAEAFAQGASIHHHVEILSVRQLHIAPCRGCNCCFHRSGNACVQHDDMRSVYAQLAQADMLVIASPVYFYGISAQLKALIDRLHNPIRDTFRIRQAALLLVGASSLPDLFRAIEVQYELCIRFFGLNDVGRILVRNVKEKDGITGHQALKEAYELGVNL